MNKESKNSLATLTFNTAWMFDVIGEPCFTEADKLYFIHDIIL